MNQEKTKLKKCNRCEEEKPLEEFHKHKKNKDGHHNRCKQCRSEYRSFENRKKRAAKLNVKGNYKLREEREI